MRTLAIAVFSCFLGCSMHRSVARVVENRPFGAFSSVFVSGPVNVNVSIEPSHSVQIACDEREVPQIHTTVQGSTLVIESQPRYDWHFHFLSSSEPNEGCAVNVTLPELLTVSARGSGDIAVHGEVADLQRVEASASGDVTLDRVHSSARLEIAKSGSGGIEVHDLTAKEVVADLSGSGDLRATGTADSVTVDAHGSGSVDVAELEAQVCKVRSRGSADISVFASRLVQVDASGSGDISVRGRPTERQIEIRGSGSLTWN